MHELVVIPYSPWSRKASVALRLCDIAFRTRSYVPTLSEPRLRLQLGKWTGAVSVPVLFPTDGPPVSDSFEIAQWANAQANGTLFPEISAIRRLDQHANALQSAARIRTARRVILDEPALVASLPPLIAALGPVGRWIGRDAAARLIRKYSMEDDSDEALFNTIRDALQALQTCLAGRPYFLENQLSYADVTVALATCAIKPMAWQHLDEAALRAWQEPSLTEAFADLISWRDRLLQSLPRVTV